TSYALAGAAAPSDARVDVGPVGPDGRLLPLAGISMTKGPPDRYAAGVWLTGRFVPLAEACTSQRGGGREAGLAAGGGGGRVPLIAAGADPAGPHAAPLADCSP
ncbi:MAG: hypothetical protein ACREQY_23575, partial [Candidatus Binatia bacterium]